MADGLNHKAVDLRMGIVPACRQVPVSGGQNGKMKFHQMTAIGCVSDFIE